jgi:DNA-binding XRE family transcriptional regulator
MEGEAIARAEGLSFKRLTLIRRVSRAYDRDMPKISAPRALARQEEARVLGGRLGQARNRTGLSQAEAAKALAVPQSQIAKLELGQRRLGFIEGLRLATLYSISPEELDPALFEEDPRGAARSTGEDHL